MWSIIVFTSNHVSHPSLYHARLPTPLFDRNPSSYSVRTCSVDAKIVSIITQTQNEGKDGKQHSTLREGELRTCTTLYLALLCTILYHLVPCPTVYDPALPCTLHCCVRPCTSFYLALPCTLHCCVLPCTTLYLALPCKYLALLLLGGVGCCWMLLDVLTRGSRSRNTTTISPIISGFALLTSTLPSSQMGFILTNGGDLRRCFLCLPPSSLTDNYKDSNIPQKAQLCQDIWR